MKLGNATVANNCSALDSPETYVEKRAGFLLGGYANLRTLRSVLIYAIFHRCDLRCHHCPLAFVEVSPVQAF